MERATSVRGSDVLEVRLRSGLSQQEFAKSLGVSQQAISNWERGYRRPKGLYLVRLEEMMATGARKSPSRA